MGSTIGRFDFTVTKMESDEQVVFAPFLVFDMKHWGDTTRGGSPAVSPHLMSDVEIDEYVLSLKADLDAVALRAKRALAKARDQTMNRVSDRASRAD